MLLLTFLVLLVNKSSAIELRYIQEKTDISMADISETQQLATKQYRGEEKHVFDTGVNCPFKDSSGGGRKLLPEIQTCQS